MNIVVPLAGSDPRFAGLPKPLIPIRGRLLIEHILERHRITKNDRLIFIILEEHERTFGMSEKLRSAFGSGIIIRTLARETKGSPCSVLEGAKDLVDNDEDVLIELGDVLRDLKGLYADIAEK